jgi:hypothetical protein
MHAGNVDRAADLHYEALALLRGPGELWGMGIALLDLAVLRVVQHRHAEARALCAEAITLGRQFGDRRAIAWCFGVLAGCARNLNGSHRNAVSFTFVAPS